MTDITAAEQLRRATEMECMPEAERNISIAFGVMRGRVIDARHRFDPDRLLPTLRDLFGSYTETVTTLVFEGSYGPGDGDCA